MPTLFWFLPPTATNLSRVAGVGAGVSTLVTLRGAANLPMMALLWGLYHSIVNVGQTWYSYGEGRGGARARLSSTSRGSRGRWRPCLVRWLSLGYRPGPRFPSAFAFHLGTVPPGVTVAFFRVGKPAVGDGVPGDVPRPVDQPVPLPARGAHAGCLRLGLPVAPVPSHGEGASPKVPASRCSWWVMIHGRFHRRHHRRRHYHHRHHHISLHNPICWLLDFCTLSLASLFSPLVLSSMLFLSFSSYVRSGDFRVVRAYISSCVPVCHITIILIKPPCDPA